MKNLIPISVAGTLLFSLTACDEAFSPSSPFQPRMVIYSVLSSQSDSQFVRVYSTYIPEGNDPSKNPEERPVTDAAVRISQGSIAYTLREITLERPDKSRYQSDIKVYFVHPLQVQAGKPYTLTVSSPTLGTATASATVPGKGEISPYETLTLSDPWHPFAAQNVTANVTLSPQARAFIVRLFVDYLTDMPQGTLRKRVEIPVNIKTISADDDIYDFVYPKMVRRTTPAVLNPRNPQQEHLSFRTCAYQKSIELIHAGGFNVRFIRAVFYLIQIDEPLYNYYSVVHGFQDPRSIRTDEPDYTNVKGGVGIFASTSIDSTVWSLPERIYPPPRVPETQCPN